MDDNKYQVSLDFAFILSLFILWVVSSCLSFFSHQVFNADQVKSFQRLEDLDVIVRCSVDFVLETLCADPKSCWSKGEKSEKSSTMVAFVKHGQGAGRPVTYVRTVRAQIGPLKVGEGEGKEGFFFFFNVLSKFCSVFYTSQFLDTNTVQMHCCEAGGIEK